MNYQVRLYGLCLALTLIWTSLSGQNKYLKPKLIIPSGNIGRVDVLDFSEDSKFLISAYGTRQLILWDVLTGKIINTFEADNRVTDAHFYKSWILASTVSGTIQAWQYLGEEAEKFWNASSSPINNFLVANNQIFAAAENNSILVFDYSKNELLYELNDLDVTFNKIDFSKAQQLLAFGSRSGNVLLFNPETREKEFEAQVIENPIQALKFSLNGDHLFIADGKGYVYELGTNPVELVNKAKVFQNQAYDLLPYSDFLLAVGRDTNANFRVISWKDSLNTFTLPFEEDKSHPNFVYGISSIAVSDDGLMAIPNNESTLRIFDLNKKVGVNRLSGYSNPVRYLQIDMNKNLFFARENEIHQFDLDGHIPHTYLKLPIAIDRMDIQTNRMAILGTDSMLYVREGEDIAFRKKVDNQAFLAPVKLSLDGFKLVYRESPKYLNVIELNTGKNRRVKVENCYDFKLTYRGILAYSNRSELVFYDWNKLKPQWEIESRTIRQFDSDEEGMEFIAIFNENNRSIIRKWQTDKFSRAIEMELPADLVADRIVFSNDLSYYYTFARSVGKNNAKPDYQVYQWNTETGTLTGTLDGHNYFVENLVEYGNKMIATCSGDGTIRFWDRESGGLILNFVPLNKDDWVAIDSLGLFDASRRAMKKMHFNLNNEIIPLKQIKQKFYEPKLIQKSLSLIDEPYFNSSIEQYYTLHPEINLSVPSEGMLKFQLKNRGGGIGPVSIKINNKEAIRDARTLEGYDSMANKVTFPLIRHPYMRSGDINKVTIEAYNQEGYPVSNEKYFYYLPDTESENEAIKPKLFAICVGISDYVGKAIDLNFAAKDALDFESVLKTGAANLFGDNQFEIISMTTESGDRNSWPTKQNIIKKLKYISEVATPGDVFVMYYAGHGLDVDNDEDFYFLTAEAETPFVKSREEALEIALSSSELGEALKSIPALNQLLIIDACHSGKIVDGLFSNEGQIKTEGIRALDAVKDKTGVYILASSEGEELSYESSHLEQGLLTYSLLFGFKGEALVDNQYIDVINTMQYVRKKVPELAGDIGQQQIPVVQMPTDASSFSIGQLLSNERQSIELNSPKPIVLGSSFQQTESMIDDLGLSELMDDRVRELRGNDYLFIDQGRIFNNAYSVYGRYTEGEGLIEIEYSIFHNRIQVHTESIKVRTGEEAVEIISTRLTELVQLEK